VAASEEAFGSRATGREGAEEQKRDNLLDRPPGANVVESGFPLSVGEDAEEGALFMP
jgi:hypothetical protein